ncbi:hypothetical protein Hte_011824 [Hypoxylon texense]
MSKETLGILGCWKATTHDDIAHQPGTLFGATPIDAQLVLEKLDRISDAVGQGLELQDHVRNHQHEITRSQRVVEEQQREMQDQIRLVNSDSRQRDHTTRSAQNARFSQIERGQIEMKLDLKKLLDSESRLDSRLKSIGQSNRIPAPVSTWADMAFTKDGILMIAQEQNTPEANTANYLGDIVVTLLSLIMISISLMERPWVAATTLALGGIYFVGRSSLGW